MYILVSCPSWISHSIVRFFCCISMQFLTLLYGTSLMSEFRFVSLIRCALSVNLTVESHFWCITRSSVQWIFWCNDLPSFQRFFILKWKLNFCHNGATLLEGKTFHTSRITADTEPCITVFFCRQRPGYIYSWRDNDLTSDYIIVLTWFRTKHILSLDRDCKTWTIIICFACRVNWLESNEPTGSPEPAVIMF